MMPYAPYTNYCVGPSTAVLPRDLCPCLALAYCDNRDFLISAWWHFVGIYVYSVRKSWVIDYYG